MAKHNYDKKLFRLVSIITKLNNGDSLSVTDLAKEFCVGPRTIQRDINEKLKHLYPIYQENKLRCNNCFPR